MTPYLIRRLLLSIPTLIVISALIFTILALAPGDPMAAFATDPSMSEEVRQDRKSVV